MAPHKNGNDEWSFSLNPVDKKRPELTLEPTPSKVAPKLKLDLEKSVNQKRRTKLKDALPKEEKHNKLGVFFKNNLIVIVAIVAIAIYAIFFRR